MSTLRDHLDTSLEAFVGAIVDECPKSSDSKIETIVDAKLRSALDSHDFISRADASSIVTQDLIKGVSAAVLESLRGNLEVKSPPSRSRSAPSPWTDKFNAKIAGSKRPREEAAPLAVPPFARAAEAAEPPTNRRRFNFSKISGEPETVPQFDASGHTAADSVSNFYMTFLTKQYNTHMANATCRATRVAIMGQLYAKVRTYFRDQTHGARALLKRKLIKLFLETAMLGLPLDNLDHQYLFNATYTRHNNPIPFSLKADGSDDSP